MIRSEDHIVTNRHFIKPDLSFCVASFSRFSLYCLNYNNYSSSHIELRRSQKDDLMFLLLTPTKTYVSTFACCYDLFYEASNYQGKWWGKTLEERMNELGTVRCSPTLKNVPFCTMLHMGKFNVSSNMTWGSNCESLRGEERPTSYRVQQCETIQIKIKWNQKAFTARIYTHQFTQ